jgi:RNA polymerase sigma factor (sigma-70 family)
MSDRRAGIFILLKIHENFLRHPLGGRRRKSLVIDVAHSAEPAAGATNGPNNRMLPKWGARRVTFAEHSQTASGDIGGDSAAPVHRDLIAAVAERHDRAAFVALFQAYAPRIKGYLIRLGGGDIAEEMAQEAMLKVWRKAQLFDPAKASAGTWIFTIARNLYIDRRRRERRPEFDPSDPLLSADNPETADGALGMQQSEEHVRAAMSGLPEDQMKVVTMAFYEDKSHSAIAAELDLPLGTVKSRLRRAFARLREELGERP